MKPICKYLWVLLLLNSFLDAAGYLLVATKKFDIEFADITILSSLFSVIAIITIVIFFKGQTKEPESQTFHTLVSLGVKFLLEMTLALVWFIVAKKTSFPHVLIFFVLYLTLTLFSVSIILKTLKNKSL